MSLRTDCTAADDRAWHKSVPTRLKTQRPLRPPRSIPFFASCGLCVRSDVHSDGRVYPSSDFQPGLASRRRKSFAAASFVTRMLAPSYRSFFPARSETTPRSIASVSFAAYSNGLDDSVFPFAASTQFNSWLSFGMRASFCGGVPNESCTDCGSRRGLYPYVSCISLPLLPTRSAPPPLFNSSSSPSSGGFGGSRPPSYHINFTAGLSP